jgi:hypothetical protein
MDGIIRSLERQHDASPEDNTIARKLIAAYRRTTNCEVIENEESHYIVKLINRLGGHKWLSSYNSAQHNPPDVGYKTEKWASEAAVRYFHSQHARNKVLPYTRAEIRLVARVRNTVDVVNSPFFDTIETVPQ